MVALRAELLSAATGYAVWSALASKDLIAVADLRDWLHWVEQLADKVHARRRELNSEIGVPMTDQASLRWPAQHLKLLDDYEAADTEFGSDLTSSWDDEWSDRRERLAERARSVEELNGKPLGEIEGQEYGEGVALLGAVEDSLTLLLSEEEETRGRRWRPREMYRRLVAAQRQGVWDVLVDVPSGHSRERQEQTLSPRGQDVVLRAKKLTEELGSTTLEAVRFYQALAPDGRVLSDDERSAARHTLDAGARCLREASADVDLLTYLALVERIDFRPMVELLRMTQRSLVLVLSDNRKRRDRAISADRLITYYQPIYELLADLWGLPTWEQLRSNA